MKNVGEWRCSTINGTYFQYRDCDVISMRFKKVELRIIVVYRYWWMFGIEWHCPITFLIFSDDKKESLILKILKYNLNTDKTFDRHDE